MLNPCYRGLTPPPDPPRGAPAAAVFFRAFYRSPAHLMFFPGRRKWGRRASASDGELNHHDAGLVRPKTLPRPGTPVLHGFRPGASQRHRRRAVVTPTTLSPAGFSRPRKKF